MQVAFYLAGEITQVEESIPWVRCASGNVFIFPWPTFNYLCCLNTFLIITGAVIAKRRYTWEDRSWKAAVRTHNIVDRTRIVDGSQCCRLCREKYPETKVWQKYKLYSMCSCMTFDDNFDPTKYEKKHGAYSIGSC